MMLQELHGDQLKMSDFETNPVGTLQKLKDTEKELEKQTALTNYWRNYVEEEARAGTQTSKSREGNV